MRIETDMKLDYSDVLLRPKRSTLVSRSQVDLYREWFIRSAHHRVIPIIASNMDGVGTFEMAETLSEQGLFTCLVKTYTGQELIEFFKRPRPLVALSIGTSIADFEKFETVYMVVGKNLKWLCIDVANGYTESFVDFIRMTRAKYPQIVIIAGNVVTADQTQELILAGADIIKVGIGPGSVCTTRIQTGVGYPQLSAVIECADAAHGLGGYVVADGGCTSAGDVAKAFAAGADWVMLGGMLAGHDEGGGQVIKKIYATNELDEKGKPINKTVQWVQFYGMSSQAANDKHFGGLKDYRSSEGREVLVPYRGKIKDTINNILGGLRSTCTYVGASKLKQLSRCATFIRCTDTHNRVFEGREFQ